MWNIVISKKDVPELPPKAAELLVQYVNVTDGSLEYSIDSGKFYSFIRHCHSKRVGLTEKEFLALLLRIGCSKKESFKLSSLYGHGRKLLQTTVPK